MHLTAIEIHGFRSLQELSLPKLGRLNALIGRNNSGKSNTIKAVKAFFDFFKDPSPIHLANNYHGFDFSLSRSDLTATGTFSLDEGFARNAASVLGLPMSLDDGPIEGDATLKVRTITNEPFASVLEHFVVRLRNPLLDAESMIYSLEPTDAHNTLVLYQGLTVGESKLHWLEETNTMFNSLANVAQLTTLREIAAGTSSRLPVSPTWQGRSDDFTGEMKALAASSTGVEDFASKLGQQIMKASAAVETLRRSVDATLEGGHKDITLGSKVLVTAILDRLRELKVEFLAERRPFVAEPEASHLLELRVTAEQEHLFDGIKRAANHVIGIDMLPYRRAGTRSGGPLSGELRIEGRELEFNGAGIREALRVVLDLEVKKPDILFIEEPEVHLHPGLERQLLTYLKSWSAKTQTILTTHSTNFIDANGDMEIYVCTKDKLGNTEATRFNADKDVRHLSQELGIKLGAMFMYEHLVFVEGVSDVDVLQSLASVIGINLADAGVGFVVMGGVRNMTHFAASSTMEFLFRRNVALTFIIDRDERTDAEVEQLRRKLGTQATLRVLGRRQIENYLLAAAPLAALINDKRIEGGLKEPEVTSGEVATAMTAAVEKLAFKTIERRVRSKTMKPLNPDRRILIEAEGETQLAEVLRRQFSDWRETIDKLDASLKDVIESETNDLRSRWETDKWDLVSGALLLDEVMGRFNTSYDKVADGPNLASRQVASQVHPLLVEILSGLVATASKAPA